MKYFKKQHWIHQSRIYGQFDVSERSYKKVCNDFVATLLNFFKLLFWQARPFNQFLLFPYILTHLRNYLARKTFLQIFSPNASQLFVRE